MKTVDEMIEVNRKQSLFYDSISLSEDHENGVGYAKHKSANWITRFWAALRYRQQEANILSGVDEVKWGLHRKWLKIKCGGTSLELGCFRGTYFTDELIESSSRYVGIDLSAKAVEALNFKIQQLNLHTKAKAVSGDFLTFGEDVKFDLIYAHGVLHHFENSEPLFKKISNLLSPDGVLILSEPSQVNRYFSLIRSLYRPFQSDNEWEWPFTRKTVNNLEENLEPIEGFGWGRRSLFLSIFVSLPVIGKMFMASYLKNIKTELSSPWSDDVWLNSTIVAVYKKKHA